MCVCPPGFFDIDELGVYPWQCVERAPGGLANRVFPPALLPRRAVVSCNLQHDTYAAASS